MRPRLTNPRLRGILRPLGLLLLLLALAACHPKTPVTAKTPAVTAPTYVGEIAVVNLVGKFVLIELRATGAPPEAGTPLTAITEAGESVRLKVTAERKRPFVSADILSGEPARGQRVYR